jgi:ABC-type Fe3+-siderophore transport system permease subunit
VIFRKYSIGLLILDLPILLAGYLLVTFTDVTLKFSEIAILTLCFSAIILLSLYIFSKGLKKETASQTMHLLVAVAVKMLLELVLALIWFFAAKKTFTSSVLLFFVLYLAFSLYSIFLMLDTLKHKPL